MKTLPNTMMIALRGRRGLEKSDDSQDEKIMAMSPEYQAREIIAWELGDYTSTSWFANVLRETGADIRRL